MIALGLGNGTSRFPATQPSLIFIFATMPTHERCYTKWAPILVGFGATGLAAGLYAKCLPHTRFLFDELGADRNAHLLLGMQLANDIRMGEFLQWFSDFNSAKLWPPLHAFILSVVLLVGGLNVQLGLVPSLLAWAGSVVIIYLLARRLAPRRSELAGLLGALLFATSPAHAVFSTDIMLESLGTFLTLFALLCYVIWRQDDSILNLRSLGCAITALLLCKYNYYTLTVLGILAGDMLTAGRARLDALRPLLAWSTSREAIKRQLIHPLNYLFVFFFLGAVAILVTGGGAFDLMGTRVSLTTPHNLLQCMVLVFLLRVLVCYRRHRKLLRMMIPKGLLTILGWHVFPAAIWFALPKRLGGFLSYITSQNTPGIRIAPLDAIQYYVQPIAIDYHAHAVIAVVVLACTLLAVRPWPRPTSAIVSVGVFVSVTAMLTVLHPHVGSRFLHTWLPAAWALVPAGLMRVGTSWPMTRLIFIGASLGLVAGLPVFAKPPAGLAPWEKNQSTLEITDAYLHELSDVQRVAMFSTVSIRHQLAWTYLARYPNNPRPYVMLDKFSHDASQNQQRFAAWLQKTDAELVVFIDIPIEKSYYFGRYAHYAQYRTLLADQAVFRIAKRFSVPSYDADITIWRRMDKPVANTIRKGKS